MKIIITQKQTTQITRITFHRHGRRQTKCKAHYRWVQTGIPVLTAQYAHACLRSISIVTKSKAEKAVTMETERVIKGSMSGHELKRWPLVRILQN